MSIIGIIILIAMAVITFSLMFRFEFYLKEAY